jgi:hypothetical protein
VGPVTLGMYTTNGGDVDIIEGAEINGAVTFTSVTRHIASTTHVSIAAKIAKFSVVACIRIFVFILSNIPFNSTCFTANMK